MSVAAARLRLFLDTGVIVAGLFQRWGAAKVVLTLCTVRQRYTVVLAAEVVRERQGVLSRQGGALAPADRRTLEADLAGWLGRVRVERVPAPSAEDVLSYPPTVLPVLRHINDLRPVISAIQARPDWVVSSYVPP